MLPVRHLFRTLAAFAAVILILSVSSAITRPQDPQTSPSADRDGGEQEAQRGTLVVAGRIFPSPFDLVPTEVNVQIDGLSIHDLIEKRREEFRANQPEVPRKYVLRHEARSQIGAAFRAGRDSGQLDGGILNARAAAAACPLIAEARIEGGSLHLLWADGDEEDILFTDSAAPREASSTEEQFREGFDRYRALLAAGGFVALGANYIVTGSEREGADLLDAVQRATSGHASATRAVEQLEWATGSRAFAVDLVHHNLGR